MISIIDVLEKILKLKNERGWSLYKLADEAGLPQSTVANMFPRKTLPSLYTLNQICEAFGITLSEFFDDGVIVSDETRILSVFRGLTEKDRKTVLALAEYLRKIEQQN